MLLSTDRIAERNRLEYWREIVCGTFVELECESAAERDFYGSIEFSELGDIRFSRVSAAAQHVTRTAARIARSDQEYFYLSLQLHGRGCHKQGGRVAHLLPGDFVIFDTTRPYELLFADSFSQLVLSLPHELLKSRLADAERLTACTVPGQSGSGRLAAVFIRQLAAEISSLDTASLPRLQASLADLVATALSEQRSQALSALSSSRNLLTQRVLQYIEDKLPDPELSCSLVAARHRISERYLRLLFQDLGTSASDWIWRRRLECARQELTDPGLRHLSITAVGFNWGFKDAAHFSRAFRAQYGVAPSEWRVRARKN